VGLSSSPALKFAATSMGTLSRSSPLRLVLQAWPDGTSRLHAYPAAAPPLETTITTVHSVSFLRRRSLLPPASSSNPAYCEVTRWQHLHLSRQPNLGPIKHSRHLWRAHQGLKKCLCVWHRFKQPQGVSFFLFRPLILGEVKVRQRIFLYFKREPHI
jgi:hypothetical protein